MLTTARLILVVVFAAAGVAKLWDQAGVQTSLADFGVPSSVRRSFGLLLPPMELLVAGTLLWPLTAWWSAVAALILLTLFTTAIGRSLARGSTPSCRCFGQLSAAPIGTETLVRNFILLALAGLLVWQGWWRPIPPLFGWFEGLSAAQQIVVVGVCGLVVVLAVMAALAVQLLAQQGRLLLRIEALEQQLAMRDDPLLGHMEIPGLPIGSDAPRFDLPDLTSEMRTLNGLLQPDRPLLLLFLDPDCVPCSTLLPDIAQWQREEAEHLTSVVISRGPEDTRAERYRSHQLNVVLFQDQYEVADLYLVDQTPSAVLIRPDGTIGSPVVIGPDPIRELVAHIRVDGSDGPWADREHLPMAVAQAPASASAT